MSPLDLTIKEFADGLRGKKFSAREVVGAYATHAEERNKEIGAYLFLDKDGALEQAERVDTALAEGRELPPLAGVPFALKDNMLVQGLPATAASKILAHYIAAYDATVVAKLKDAGVAILGKTNMDEFAMGSSTENSAFGVTRNPHDMERVPGGSSGGSAAAIAANMALGALGSDTGGSIREPASFCGVVGMKPTYGAVSRYGLMAMASSLDQIGPFGKTVEDTALIFKTIAGQDVFDATSVANSYGDELTTPKFEKIKKLVVGLPDEYFIDGLSKEVSGAIEKVIASLKNSGIAFKRISLPNTKHALSVYYIIMPAEVSANLARFDGLRYAEAHSEKEDADMKLLDMYLRNRGEGFGAEARRRIMLGTYVLSAGYYDAYYSKAQKVRQLIASDFAEAFKDVDVILTPVVPTPAFKIGEKTNDPLTMYLSDIFTIPVNLAGLPAISIPARDTDKLPVGFQLIGKHFREEDILGLGQFYEHITS